MQKTSPKYPIHNTFAVMTLQCVEVLQVRCGNERAWRWVLRVESPDIQVVQPSTLAHSLPQS